MGFPVGQELFVLTDIDIVDECTWLTLSIVRDHFFSDLSKLVSFTRLYFKLVKNVDSLISHVGFRSSGKVIRSIRLLCAVTSAEHLSLGFS